MKKILFSLATTALLIVGSFVIPQSSEAVPAFARQTGLACNSCHFQHFPTLNQFGRAFKAGGFTMVGGQSMVEGDLLSMPSVLNASLITKIIYEKTNGASNASKPNNGELLFPDEAALFLGGRVGEHIGFALEAQMSDPGGAMFDTFKMPIGIYDINGTHIELIPFTTAAHGAPFPTEYLNTGAVRANRVLERRREISAHQKVGLNGAAQGIALAAYHPMGMATYTAWQPEGATKSDADFLHYIRAVVTPQVGGWDLGGGVQWYGGKSGRELGAFQEEADAWAIDAQAQGEVSGLPLGVYLTYANAAKVSTTTTHTSLFNPGGTTEDKTAWAILAELGVLPGKATVAAAYMDYNAGTGSAGDTSATTIGGTYMLAQNVELSINASWYDNDQGVNGDQLTLFRIFSGF
ncbi:MAG: hypothetical protein GY721_04870 [Deltaproteobacteria bacterium]|nr:hypothetical protein [Deltaproteobacteria bacterium]